MTFVRSRILKSQLYYNKMVLENSILTGAMASQGADCRHKK